MLGAVISLVVILAAAYALTQIGGVITLLFVAALLFLAYRRLSLLAFTVTFTALLAAYTLLGASSAPAGVWKGLLWVLLASLWLLNVRPLRKALITRPFMKTYLKLLPRMSQTEKEALEAGTVWWDGELFTGAPKWEKLLAARPPQLSAAEQAFLDGPCEELCRMLDEWNITHERADLPPQVWEFLKTRGFFAMIIPKRYGGLEFSAYAHSCVLAKIASRSATTSSTVAVPNSLGPAELLNHYGTEEQKNYYLPRLARGEEVPCFALTGPRAGSDAASIPDTGIVTRGQWQGREVLGLKLNFSKRYITLAPVATVIGLAFRMFDPERLLGDKTDLGITCALIPRNTPGVSIGRRHFPLNIPFQNGPLHGRDVFVPLDCIIGGPAMAGAGWRMLVEQLSVGRCISLPSNATGAAKAGVWATGAYARIRAQFNQPIARFEGVESVLARMVALTYTMDAARSVTVGAIDAGEKPSVPSAVLKYHITEMGRRVANDAMDLHGGKGIMLGPRNYLARGYEIVPVAITVEGANLLTRNLIIFGQGALRCHPFVLREMNAARNPDRSAGSMHSTAHSSPTSASRSRTRCAPLSWRSPMRASPAPRCRAPPRVTTSTSCVSLPRSPSPWMWRCSHSAATSRKRRACRHGWAMCSRACISPRWCSSTTRTRDGSWKTCRSSSGRAAACSMTPRSNCTGFCATSPTACWRGSCARSFSRAAAFTPRRTTASAGRWRPS